VRVRVLGVVALDGRIPAPGPPDRVDHVERQQHHDDPGSDLREVHPRQLRELEAPRGDARLRQKAKVPRVKASSSFLGHIPPSPGRTTPMLDDAERRGIGRGAARPLLVFGLLAALALALVGHRIHLERPAIELVAQGSRGFGGHRFADAASGSVSPSDLLAGAFGRLGPGIQALWPGPMRQFVTLPMLALPLAAIGIQAVVEVPGSGGADFPALAAPPAREDVAPPAPDRVRIAAYQTDRVAIDAACDGDCLLVLTDLHCPG
jgi:hypothetical protein